MLIVFAKTARTSQESKKSKIFLKQKNTKRYPCLSKEECQLKKLELKIQENSFHF